MHDKTVEVVKDTENRMYINGVMEIQVKLVLVEQELDRDNFWHH